MQRIVKAGNKKVEK